MTRAAARWTAAVGYVAFIYATLNVVRIPLNFLRQHGVLQLSLTALYLACFVALVGLMLWRKGREPWRHVLLVVIFVAYYLIASRLPYPEEEIHLLEYGLVGVLFVRALLCHVRLVPALLGGLVLAALAGWIDEVLQGALPSRHFDPKDIALNIVSSGLGLILYLAFPRGDTTTD